MAPSGEPSAASSGLTATVENSRGDHSLQPRDLAITHRAYSGDGSLESCRTYDRARMVREAPFVWTDHKDLLASR